MNKLIKMIINYTVYQINKHKYTIHPNLIKSN